MQDALMRAAQGPQGCSSGACCPLSVPGPTPLATVRVTHGGAGWLTRTFSTPPTAAATCHYYSSTARSLAEYAVDAAGGNATSCLACQSACDNNDYCWYWSWGPATSEATQYWHYSTASGCTAGTRDLPRRQLLARKGEARSILCPLGRMASFLLYRVGLLEEQGSGTGLGLPWSPLGSQFNF